MFTTNVLDKDGVSAAVHLATMCSYLTQTENVTLAEKLKQLYLTYGYHYGFNSYFSCYEPKTVLKIFERIRNFNGKNTVSYLKNFLEFI
jgi:phosphomannomutase